MIHTDYTATKSSVKSIFLKDIAPSFLNQLVLSIAFSGGVVHVCGFINEHIKIIQTFHSFHDTCKQSLSNFNYNKNNVSITRNQFIMRVYSGLSYGKLIFCMERNYLCQHIKK